MKKKHSEKQHKNISFEHQGQKSFFLPTERRMLTAEGFKKRTPSCQSTRSVGIYRGRRQGKKG